MQNFEIKPAIKNDVPLILKFIREHAEHANNPKKIIATESALETSFFGQSPSAECIFAYANDQPVGFAIFCPCFSADFGESILFLEDLYVQPESRSQGIGRALLRYVAKLAIERNYKRLDLNTQKKNEKALRFYKSINAMVRDHVVPCRLTNEALRQLAEE